MDISWATLTGTIIGVIGMVAFGWIYIAIIKRRMR